MAESLSHEKEYADWEAPATASAAPAPVAEPVIAAPAANPKDLYPGMSAVPEESYLEAREAPDVEQQVKSVDYALETLSELIQGYRNYRTPVSPGTINHHLNKVYQNWHVLNSWHVANLSMQIEQIIRFRVITRPVERQQLVRSFLFNADNLAEIAGRAEHLGDKKDFLDVLEKFYYWEDDKNQAVAADNEKKQIGEAFTQVFGDEYQKNQHKYVTPMPDYDSRKFLDLFIKLHPERASDYVEVVKTALESNAEPLKDLNSASSNPVLNMSETLLGTLAMTDNPSIAESLSAYMLKHGLDWSRLKEVWATTTKKQAEHVASNFLNIALLDNLRPGACERLHNAQGIDFFGRYRPETLLRQDDLMGEDVAYGTLLTAKDDHNGAFYEDRNVFYQLDKSLAELGFAMRITEANGKFSAGRRLARLDRQYGAKHLSSFCLAGGHGEWDSIRLGKSRERSELDKAGAVITLAKEEGREQGQEVAKLERPLTEAEIANYLSDPVLTKDDLSHGWLDQVGAYFTPDAPMVLISCSTGERRGIGEKLSERTGKVVTAPNKPTGLKSITPSIVDGHLAFDVDYSDERAAATFGR